MTKPGKIELPLEDEADFADLAARHEACTLAYENWTHRAHLALALFLLRNMALDEAIDRIRRNIATYNKACGDGTGYHETITVVFMKRIHADQRQKTNIAPLPDELERLCRDYTVESLYQYYSPELLWSDRARQVWVDPDIKALDF